MAAGGSGGIGPAQLVLYTLVALITALLLMPALLPDCEPQVEIPKEEKPYNAIVFGSSYSCHVSCFKLCDPGSFIVMLIVLLLVISPSFAH